MRVLGLSALIAIMGMSCMWDIEYYDIEIRFTDATLEQNGYLWDLTLSLDENQLPFLDLGGDEFAKDLSEAFSIVDQNDAEILYGISEFIFDYETGDKFVISILGTFEGDPIIHLDTNHKFYTYTRFIMPTNVGSTEAKINVKIDPEQQTEFSFALP